MPLSLFLIVIMTSSRGRDLVETCSEIAPDWRHALTLKEAIEERITKDGIIGIGIAATAATAAVGLIATRIAASVSRKR
ncbi:Mitochondrial fission 1 protein A [Trifolium repens]|nr:Mitochondrial fission 1 protein A [Trifolium repens]